MFLDYRSNGVVRIDMRKYVKETYKLFPEELKGTVTSPAAEHLREVRDDADKLEDKMRQIFHTITARCLFSGKRARPDILTTVSFLTTRVKEPDVDDWKKIKRLMTYMKKTADDVLTLSAKNLTVVKWWVDRSYTVHKDAKSQTGATMSMGSGAIYSLLQKQKINTRSSTEMELVAADDMLPQVLWTKYFLEEQGMFANHILYQDNTSAQRLEMNGKMSSGNRTKHMDVRYFFIKDRVDAGDFKEEHCNTKDMRGDYFTKPLQGKIFRYLPALIMGFEIITTDGKPHSVDKFDEQRTVLPKECIGSQD